ncbi:Ca2+-binding RTX toxin-like protein [Pararhizobium capsulatum DSM 1112]|uniref:Ca2+-binding RTX toxin-like protein n=1 Tax=Pararhizobium capsulatum DSM 1112 TaxID=1121113 RepID=A0ABU0BR60_9HYPH|nr:calcium-binding protein [Pararhizobium capsulatum]MDQ0319357.1 Ca2+-binding RTX toxin-like protein [Pararhizobium capsulatum DSM 1112]
MSTANYSFELDPDSFVFRFAFDYQIDGYSDPETGEYFADTSRYASYGNLSGWSWTQAGYGYESGSGTIELGFDTTPGLQKLKLQFTAQNGFSGAAISASWNVFSAPFETTNQHISGTDTADILISGSGADRLLAGAGDDYLFAGGGKDRLEAGPGNDLLNGGTGRDVMIGGSGDDFYYVDVSTDKVVELAGEGRDIVWSIADYKLSANVEELRLMGLAVDGVGNGLNNLISGNSANNTLKGGEGNDQLYGDAGNDSLFGEAGTDYLDGGSGADRMSGGVDNDNYSVDDLNDRVIEARNGGFDLVNVSYQLTSYTLGANVEALAVTGEALHGTGNGLNNDMFGGYGADIFEGLGGADTLRGNGGSDRLIGGRGNDILLGGADADVFVFNKGDGHDEVTDFRHSDHDTIALHLGSRFDTFAEVQAVAQAAGSQGGDTLLTFGPKDSILLHDVSVTSLSASDFSYF